MSRYCLIVLQSPLVAQDLALTLRDLTGAIPILAERSANACEKLADLGPGDLMYAFVHSDAATLRNSPLCDKVERLGARLVLLGHAAELEAASSRDQSRWPVLPQPFGEAQVAELLERCPPLTVEDT